MYAELVAHSSFSFLRGASHPEEMVAVAAQLGLSAIAIADRDGLYGAVKAHTTAKAMGARFILSAELTVIQGPPLVVYVENAEGYRNLCRLISRSRLSHSKGEAGLSVRSIAAHSRGLW